MAYQALYRKWRPQTFSAVVGQAAITTTLKNAIKTGKISHAFLFSGPRGTGKTSCAKIFAKALNCTNLKDGEPCNQCANCLAANAGAMNDMIEIDAASNNGVDQIRDIRDKVKYAPTQGKYKVYIIDEVHMLSMGAFNALLKTLEEPPANVVFILATTELQKVPATIISRTQRYQFKRLDLKTLMAEMVTILSQEKITYDEKALQVVAQVADGGMRDALSLLDQLLSYESGKVTYQDALKMTGFAAQEEVEKLFLALLKLETTPAFQLAKQMRQAGASVQNILSELIRLTTKTLLALKADEKTTFLTADFIQQVKPIPESRYFRMIQLANEALNALRYTNQQQIPLDVFVVQSTHPQERATEKKAVSSTVSSADFAALKKQVTVLAQKFDQVGTSPVSVSNHDSHLNGVEAEKNEKKEVAKVSNRQAVYHVLEKATRQDLEAVKDIWPDLLSTLGVSQRALLDVLEPVAASHGQIVLKCQYELWFERANKDNDLLNQVTDEIAKLTKHDYQLVLIADSAWLEVRRAFVTSHKNELIAKKKQQLEQNRDVQQPQSGEDEASTQEPAVIRKAKALFGDVAHVKD